MDAGRTLLQSPGESAVSCRDDAAVSSHGPTASRTIGGEGNGVEMIFCRRSDLSPFVSTVFRSQHQAAGAYDHRSLPVKNVETIERHDRARVLALPLKPAV